MSDKHKTVKSIGMDLPIIADLGDGWFLAAHPNGACIANQNVLTVLWPHIVDDEVESDGIPQDVRCKAVEEFERFAWPRIKAEFYEPETDLDTQD